MTWTKHSALTWSALLVVLTCVIAESWAGKPPARGRSPGRSAQGGPASRTQTQSPPRGAGGVDGGQSSTSPPDLRSTPAGDQNATYDYLVLSQVWGPGICAAIPRCAASGRRDYWTIHGLWPTADPASPEYCPGEEFNATVLDPIKRELNKYWPARTGPQELYSTFWQYQWEKHGTCAGDIPALNGTLNFFQTTLVLYHKYNVKMLLLNRLITPSPAGTYSAAQIRNALFDGNQKKVDLKCQKARIQNNDVSVLTEIRFCLDKSLEPINCQGKNGGCGRHNYYLPTRG